MNESNNEIISTVTYSTVERIMGWYDQKTKRSFHCIHLYSETISTAKNTFKLEHVHDMSYKPFSSGAGFFYLHTSQGVFSFEIDSDPNNFIHAYKELRR
ncbi:hypothetical protein [Sporosarcina sp. G11-34]|uniref:hypothetical protein n=1 Tax=Sporosarcina sp. G11-34 TaxID=2849605 RepID=UPI0022A95F57|nr:hypothetical protein [Sporosarcina sp. G11-34]MCZ2257885.1 hypothetical protein [Sporosarcina sp. G11-34]